MDFNRRTVLKAGALSLAGTALAGCIGDDDTDDADDTDESPAASGPLEIENVTFTEGEAQGYQEFTERESTSYDESDVVWVYFEPVGFGREDSGDGEEDIDISMHMTVTSPDGEELTTEDATLSRTVPEGASVDAFFTGHFQPPTPATTGEYTVTLVVEDGIDDKTTETTTSFTIEGEPLGELAIENVEFVADQPVGYREFEPVPDDTYALGEVVWIYYEPSGFETEPAGDEEVEFDLVTTIEVTGPDGTTILDADELLRATVPADDVDEQFIFWNVRLPADAETGEYTADVGLEDRLTDRETETTTAFTVESREEPDIVEDFPAILEAELDVNVTGFGGEPDAELEYESPHPLGSEESSSEIGYVAGLFAEAVNEGWTAEKLVVTLTDGDDDRFRYEVDAEAAQAWFDGEIDDDEFVDQVFETLEEV